MPRRAWNHNIHYHDLVLRSVPPNCRLALDVGCGTGVLARRLADRSEKVIGIDVDPEILSQAGSFPNPRIQFVEGDVMTCRLPARSFDFIAAVATLHHLPLRRALWRFHDLLRPGGVVAEIGLYRAQTLVDFAVDVAAFPANWILRGLYGYFEPPTRNQNAQETLGEIRGTCKALLPGSEIERLWLEPLAAKQT